MAWIDVLGYAASATVLATFCMSTMIPLRIIALVSNILFTAFGAWAHIYPVMILHLILLPVNTVRLIQIQRLVRGLTNLQSTDLSIEHFVPFMVHRRFRADDTLTRRGERADRLIYLVHGQVKVVEIDKTIRQDKAHILILLHVLHHFLKSNPEVCPPQHPWSQLY